MAKVKDLKKGDWFTKREISDPTEMQVWIRGDYDRSEKKYECSCFGDTNKWCFIKGDKEVYTDFTF